MPIIKEEKTEIDKDAEEFDKKTTTEFGGLVARANYLSLDRPDIFATEIICREMAKPSLNDMQKMNRFAWYHLVNPRFINAFKERVGFGMGKRIVHSDNDWAGRIRSRKSTSGGLMKIEGSVKTRSNIQSTIAGNSSETEVYAMVRSA